jgi:hypothetical protein
MEAEPFGDLWTCPRCGRRFSSRNQTHACGRWTLERHLDGRSPPVVATVHAFIALAEACGPVVVIPEKTRIAFQARMSFAQLTVRSRWVDGHVVLARRRPDPRFARIETMSSRSHVHHFRLLGPGDVDDTVAGWLAEAYEVGLQRHRTRRG